MTATTKSAMTLLCFLFAAGCGGASGGKCKVAGNVAFEGKPVAEGRVTFRGEGGKGGSYSTPIADGKYTLDCEPGLYKVEITASRLTGKFVTSIEGKSEVGEMYIPAKYNSATTLTKEVTASGQDVNFDLTK